MKTSRTRALPLFDAGVVPRPLRAHRAAALLVFAAACSRGTGDLQGPEVYQNGSGALREADLGARVEGTTLELAFPITRLTGDRLPMRLSASLVELSKLEETTLASAAVDVEQREARATHRLRLEGLPPGLDRAGAAGLVVAWRATLPQGELRGRKSLYAALGRVEVQLRGSTEVPESGSVPFRVIARDPDTLQPKSGAEVSAVLEPSEAGGAATPLFSGTTGPDGELLAQLTLPAGLEEGALRVDVRAEDAAAWARATVRVVHERKLALSTDKTIYKPGQTVELRALALAGPDKAPVAGAPVVFEALDGKGNKVYKRTRHTDEFGVASIGVPTDSEVNEGTWTFRAAVAGAKAERKLRVERYNLPKLKVTVEAERAYALPGETVSGAVEARYVFGLPVTGARVVLELQTSDGTVVAADAATTGADGRARYALRVPSGFDPTTLEEGGVTLTVAAEVTDTAGQRERGARALPVAASELVVKALPEAGALVPGVENVVYVMVGDPLGRPLVATLTVEGAGPLAPLTTDRDGVAELRFTPAADATSATLELTAVDGANRSHRRALELAARREGVLLVRTDKAVYRAGETARVRVHAPASVDRVYLDVFRGAAGLESRSLALSGGVAELELPVEAGMRGALLLDAFALGGAGAVLRGAARLLVDPEDRLDIALVADRASYAPGEEAALTVQVTDARGAPAVASIGLTAVDEAVFALGGEPDDDLRAFFDLDRRVLPSELRVLGRAPAELFAAREPAAAERFARLLFASAKQVAAPGVDYNSVREELPAVRAALNARVRRDVSRYLKSLMPAARALVDRGGGDATAALGALVESGARGLVDPFGQRYAAQLGDDGNTYLLVVRSAGVDEAPGTADDVSVEAYWQWITWADEGQVDDDGAWLDVGGPFGGVAEDAAAAGGGPVPAPPNAGPSDPSRSSAGAGAPARIRADFRETVYANPTLVTDPSGRATVRIPLADSITTWRVSAQGSTRDGKLGAARAGFRTFQDFFVDFTVPTALTRGDVVELPAVVYNYLDAPTTVQVALDPAPWMTVLSGAEQAVTLGPSEVRAVKFSLRAERAGTHPLTLRARAGALADALVRAARVVPDGVIEDQTYSDKLSGARAHTVVVPADAIEGGTRVTLTLTPGFAAEAVAGTEGLLQEPSGCFEQTTSTAWPNTLVTDYLELTGQLTPELRERAVGLVTRGYQRLLTFESPTGGFNWWGDSEPGNRILSSIMLWHLKDMEGVIETDPAVRERTLAWLLGQQRADGAWASGDALHAGNETLGTSEVRTTAFIAWALAHTGWADPSVEKAAAWLRAHLPEPGDLYANALAANALAKADPAGAATAALFARLDGLKQPAAEGRIKWPTETPSWTGTGGELAALETTGLVAYGLLQANVYPESAAGAVRFIVANKDAVGSWYNTQATMNSLRALLAAASPRGSEAEGTLTVRVNGQVLPAVEVTRAEGDVHRELDLTGLVEPGANTVSLEMIGSGELSYRLSRRAYRPRPSQAPTSPLSLTVGYDRTSARVGEPVRVSAAALYTGPGTRDQVIVRLGRAPGFEPSAEDLAAIVSSGRAARYEVGPRDVTLYLMGVEGGVPRDLSLRYTPTLAIEGLAPASVIYAYYEPSIRAEAAPVPVRVTAP